MALSETTVPEAGEPTTPRHLGQAYAPGRGCRGRTLSSHPAGSEVGANVDIGLPARTTRGNWGTRMLRRGGLCVCVCVRTCVWGGSQLSLPTQEESPSSGARPPTFPRLVMAKGARRSPLRC